MDESGHKRRLVKEVNALGGYAQRVEDRFAVGRLDMTIQLKGRPAVWAEGKIVQGNIFQPTPRQYETGVCINKAGAVALLLGWKDGVMYISNWTKKAHIHECTSYPWLGDALALDKFLEMNYDKRVTTARTG